MIQETRVKAWIVSLWWSLPRSHEMSSQPRPRPPPENGLMFDLYNAPRVAAGGRGRHEGDERVRGEGRREASKALRRFDAYEFVSPIL